MLEVATSVPTFTDADAEPSHIIVYEGFLTQLVTGQLNLSVPYYTSVRTSLIRMGCIKQLRRGGGTAPSQWEMCYEPTLDAFMHAQPKKVPKQTPDDAKAEQIRNLSTRIASLEAWQKSVNEMLVAKFGTEES